MNKRYQVFVSSTYKDLQVERKEVMQALLELDCIPAGMELFPASNDDQWTLIKRVIDDSDYYLLILAGRYGSTNKDGIGYTEMEYRYALETNKPIISFLHENIGGIPADKTEQNKKGKDKLKLFRELVQEKMTKYWTNPDDLGSVVSRSMVKLLKEFPAIGWVKADKVTVDENTVKEIMRLQIENKELKERLEALNTNAPEGTDKLSQGDDKVKMEFVCKYVDKNSKHWNQNIEFEFTWNEMFGLLAPYLINECVETDMALTIKDYFKENNYEEIKNFRKDNNVSKITGLNIKIEHFQIIKVQLIALGLIQKSIKNRSVKDTLNYWKLTPYGEYVMTQLVAIKKEV